MDKRRYILIIDDNVVSRAILREIFSDRYDILEAENGKEGFSLVEKYSESIVLILLDLNMPEMNGYQFIEEMKNQNLLSIIPVIVVSADSDSSVETKILEKGVSDMIPTPIVPNIVKRRADNVINANNYRRNLESMTVDLSYELKRTDSMIFETLCSIIEQRSLESGQHIKRIRLFTEILLRQVALDTTDINLDEETIECISRASTLHDIGKIVIPDSILNKPGRFTAEEFNVMKSHTVEGAEIIHKMRSMHQKDYIEYAWQIAMYHHERWDGKGYPKGLAGDEIPLCAQAAGIADVYDALTTPRVYKPVIEHNKAIVMILSGECGAFSEKMNRALRAVAPQFEECARKFRDGEIPLDDSSEQDSNTADEVLNEAFRADYYRYVTSLQIIDGYVYEIDYDSRTYKRVSPNKNPFGISQVTGDFGTDSKLFIESCIHPEDRHIVSEHLEVSRENIENGHHTNDTCIARMRHSADEEYRRFQFSQVRIEMPSVSKHLSLIVMRELNKMIPDCAVPELYEERRLIHAGSSRGLDSARTTEVLERFQKIGVTGGMFLDMLRSCWDVLFVFNIDTGAVAFDYRLREKFFTGIPENIQEMFHQTKMTVHPDDKAYFISVLEMTVMGVVRDDFSFRLLSENGTFRRFSGRTFAVSTERKTVSHIAAVLVISDKTSG